MIKDHEKVSCVGNENMKAQQRMCGCQSCVKDGLRLSSVNDKIIHFICSQLYRC
jgi:hypothetical protein